MSYDEIPFAAIREQLLDSYKHKHIDDGCCAICGDSEARLASCVIETAEPLPDGRDGHTDGSLYVCEQCAPPCPKCGLPTLTKRVRKFMEEAKQQYELSGGCVNYGNGICQHTVLFGFLRL